MWLTETNIFLIWEGSLDKFLTKHICTFNGNQSEAANPEAMCSYTNIFCLGSSQRLSMLTTDNPLQLLLHL